jgi:hypothetical protein
MSRDEATMREAPTPRGWSGLLDVAMSVGLQALANWLIARAAREATADACADEDHDHPEAIEAARLLGVDVHAGADEIRAALRAKLANSGLHPDHGGDGSEATRLIAARNLLIERLREENRP